jgi:tetratricopeptide (TPR) repeat protein
MKYAESSEQEQDYYGAALYYKKALEIDANNVELWFRLGLAHKKVNNCQEAEKAFQEVFDRYQELKYEVAQYWLAEMQKCQGNYEMALINFRDYVSNARLRSIYEYAKAKQEMGSTKYAIENLSDTGNYLPQALGAGVNSPLSEFCPRLSTDSNMYFSSLQYFKKKGNLEVDKKEKGGISRVYEARLVDGSWVNPEEIKIPGIEAGYHIANACLGPEGDLFFSACDPNGSCKIYRSSRENASWSEAVALGEMINIDGSSQTQPYVCDINGTIHLFFASNQARGRGQMDIWYSRYDKRRKAFARPRNMGRNVNTPGNEVTPYWDTLTNRLYFSSDWHDGFGGFDIQYAEGVPNSVMKATNPGIGINSSANDLYYSRNPGNTLIYLASNRQGGQAMKGMTCCNDLYQVEELQKDTIPVLDTIPLLVVNDTVPEDTVMTEEELEEEFEIVQTYLPLALYFHNDEPNPRTWDTTTSLSYDETFDSYYNMLGRYEKQYSSLFIGPKADTAARDINGFFENKVKYGKETMDKALDALLHQLNSGKPIQLTIKGFASPLARSDYNLNLTKRRISSFRNYIHKYKDEAFVEYLDSGALTIIELAFGESKSESKVSDQLGEIAKSVYSLGAARERRIEILSIERK